MIITSKPLRYSQLGAVVAGNALEFYDFLTFSFFALQIGATFFPGRDPTASLLFSLATFGVGFATRPLGGLVIGGWGDRWGRKPAMLISFSLMGASVVGLALTPSYASIGWYAPLCVVLLRLVQGFALGGEVGPTTAYLLEVAPHHGRGLYVSLQNATQYFSTLCAGLVGFCLASVLSPTALSQWGWRLAMLLGTAVIPFGLAIRRRLPESLHPRSLESESRYERPSSVLRLALLGLVMLASATIGTYMMNYMTTFAVHTLKFGSVVAFGATIVAGSVATIGALLGGALSDRLGRKTVMLSASVWLILLVVPCFSAMVHLHMALVLLTATGLMALGVGILAASIVISLTESMPTALRSQALGVVYALAISIFGGSAQFVVTWLIVASGSALAPAWYMTAAVGLGLIGILAMPESQTLNAPAHSRASA